MFPNTFLGISLYEVCIMVGMLVALFMADKMATRRGFSVGLQKQLILCALAGILSGFFGAVLFQGFYDFLETGTFSLKSGMTFYGGILVGVPVFLAVWFWGSKPFKLDKEAREKFPVLADIGAGLLPLAHGFGRLGCFFVGCCHGQKTDAWYGVMMDGVKVVPVQLYEAIFLFLLAGGILTVYFLREKGKVKWEIPFLPLYMLAYGIWRFFIEFARGDERGKTIIPFLSPSQLVAIIMVLGGIAYILVWYFAFHKKKNTERGLRDSVENKNENKEREES